MDKKLNIFLVVTEFLNAEGNGLLDGGIANEYYKFAKQLVKMGHDVSIVAYNGEKIKRHQIFDGINVYEFNPRKYFKTIRLIIYKIRCLFDKKLIAFSTRRYMTLDGIRAFLFIKNLFKKIDIIQYTSEERLGLFSPKNIPYCIRIASYAKNFLEEYELPTNERLLFEEKQMYENSKFVFGPSKYISKMIKDDLKLNKDIEIIETPFSKSTEEIDLKYYNKIKNKNYILFFGTLGILKGCFDVAEIIYDVLDKYKDIDFVFVGKQVSHNNINPIDYLKQKAGIYAHRITYFDKMPHKYLYPIIQNANCCLMPSRTENFSNTCLEAMGFGKIVIGSKPFFNQIIADGVNGFLCEAKNPASIFAKIGEVLQLSGNERNSIENAALERIKQCSIEEKTKELINYYQKVIENWKN